MRVNKQTNRCSRPAPNKSPPQKMFKKLTEKEKTKCSRNVPKMFKKLTQKAKQTKTHVQEMDPKNHSINNGKEMNPTGYTNKQNVQERCPTKKKKILFMKWTHKANKHMSKK